MSLIYHESYWRKYFCRARASSSIILAQVPAGTTSAAVPHATRAGVVCSYQGSPSDLANSSHLGQLSFADISRKHSTGVAGWQGRSPMISHRALRTEPGEISAAKSWSATVCHADIVPFEILGCFWSHSWLRLVRVEPGPQFTHTPFSLPICAMLLTQNEIN